MGYESQISFTLDTICPWTYITRKRLVEALRIVRLKEPSVKFTTKFFPFQLYPDTPKEGEDKHEWFKKSRYGESDEKMKMYTALMGSYGESCGIDFKFGGVIANTIDAHRIIQYWQEEKGSDAVEKIVDSLYLQYFEQEKHPSSDLTLLTACISAGIAEDRARHVIEAKDEYLQDVKMMIREQKSNGIDSVPNIIIEGRKRDFTLQGAREVDEYVRALEQVIKES